MYLQQINIKKIIIPNSVVWFWSYFETPFLRFAGKTVIKMHIITFHRYIFYSSDKNNVYELYVTNEKLQLFFITSNIK